MKIPVSSKIPEERDIAVNLSVFKELMNMGDDILSSFMSLETKVVKKVLKLNNEEIPLNLLYQLYWFANRNWLANVELAASEEKVAKVKCTRRLRDACDKEIVKRTTNVTVD